MVHLVLHSIHFRYGLASCTVTNLISRLSRRRIISRGDGIIEGWISPLCMRLARAWCSSLDTVYPRVYQTEIPLDIVSMSVGYPPLHSALRPYPSLANSYLQSLTPPQLSRYHCRLPLLLKIPDSRGYYPGEKGYRPDQVAPPPQGPGGVGQDQQGQGGYMEGGEAFVPDGYGGFVRRQNPPSPQGKKQVRAEKCTASTAGGGW